MQLRKWLPLSLMLAVGGCSGTIGDGGDETTAELRKAAGTGGNFTAFESCRSSAGDVTDGKMLFAATRRTTGSRSSASTAPS